MWELGELEAQGYICGLFHGRPWTANRHGTHCIGCALKLCGVKGRRLCRPEVCVSPIVPHRSATCVNLFTRLAHHPRPGNLPRGVQVRVLVGMEEAGMAIDPAILVSQRAPLEKRIEQLEVKAIKVGGMCGRM